MEKSIAVSCGESSGDLNGAYLASALMRLRKDIHIWGAGGPRMRDAGVEIVACMTGGGTIGIAETLKALPGIAVKYFQVRIELLRRKPDIFVPIDFGAFNVRLAQIARKNGIPVVYYFPPSSWRKRPRNADKLIACGGKVITPFPWSAELLQASGIDARFVGHPLVDIVKPTVSREEFIEEFGLSKSLPIIAILPGSRNHEITEHLAPMIGCARIINKELGGAQFVVGAALGRGNGIRARIGRLYNEEVDRMTVRVIENRSYDCMAHSNFLIASSGTATLEAAILGTPMVIIYRGSPIMRFEFIFRKSVLEEFIGMPNIVVDRGVCPELINDDVTPEKISDIALSLLRDENSLAKMKNGLREVRTKLGDSGAVERAARAVIEMGDLE